MDYHTLRSSRWTMGAYFGTKTMTYYIQYLQTSPLFGELTEVCGDRGVCILDGRHTLPRLIEEAHDHNRIARGFEHFRIMRGNFREAYSIYTTVPGEPLNIRSGY